jgi:hypothetical protein
MTKLSCFLLVILGAALTPQRLFADDEISQIQQTWGENYGAFAASEHYHYRCVFTRRFKAADPSFDRHQPDPTLKLGLEIFRLGHVCRMDAVLGGDFSNLAASGATHVFDGRAAITSQPYHGSGSLSSMWSRTGVSPRSRQKCPSYGTCLNRTSESSP